MIRICEIDIMFIKCSQIYIGIRKHEIGSSTKLYYLWVKGFSTWGERDTRSFYSDCFYIVSSQPNQRAAPVAHKFVWPRPALNLDFPKSSAHASGAWRHSHPLVPIPIWDFYFDLSECHILSARALTPALMLHLINPCDKRKVLSLTKPKGKIYKTKSLCHYITIYIQYMCGENWKTK